jgi:hypothetical protein
MAKKLPLKVQKVPLPSRIKVGYMNVRTSERPSLQHEDLGKLQGLWSLGKLSPNIVIEKELSLTIKKQTLLHELFHALDYMFNTNLKENQIDLLATGILTLLTENPKLVSYLLQKEGEPDGQD